MALTTIGIILAACRPQGEDIFGIMHTPGYQRPCKSGHSSFLYGLCICYHSMWLFIISYPVTDSYLANSEFSLLSVPARGGPSPDLPADHPDINERKCNWNDSTCNTSTSVLRLCYPYPNTIWSTPSHGTSAHRLPIPVDDPSRKRRSLHGPPVSLVVDPISALSRIRAKSRKTLPPDGNALRFFQLTTPRPNPRFPTHPSTPPRPQPHRLSHTPSITTPTHRTSSHRNRNGRWKGQDRWKDWRQGR